MMPGSGSNLSLDATLPALTEQQQRSLVSLCEALSCPSRLKVFLLLCESGAQTVKGITQRLRFSQSLTSTHLKLLKLAGLVINRRQGREVWYELASRSARCDRHRAGHDPNRPADPPHHQPSTEASLDQLRIEIRPCDGVCITLCTPPSESRQPLAPAKAA
jgi:DNA-binding transcriptional ArsR family regulator